MQIHKDKIIKNVDRVSRNRVIKIALNFLNRNIIIERLQQKIYIAFLKQIKRIFQLKMDKYKIIKNIDRLSYNKIIKVILNYLMETCNYSKAAVNKKMFIAFLKEHFN